MKLLFVTPFYKPAYVYGGPTRSIPSLCEGLVELGCDVDVFTTNAGGDTSLDVATDQPVELDGVSVSYCECSTVQGSFFYSPQMKELCRRRIEEFDLVYIYGIWNYPAIASGSLCRAKDIPYVVSPRTGLMDWPMQQGWLKKWVYFWSFGRRYLNGARAIHYTTEVERRESEQLSFSANGFVVPNSVDLSEFSDLPTPGRFRTQHNLDNKTPILLFLGRLEPRKGIDIAVEAFGKVRDELPRAHFIVAGPGEEGYFEKLLHRVERLSLDDAITFTGYLDAKERLEALQDANAFILTSHTENFAMAAVEAMAARTPVVLSEYVGVAPAATQAQAGVTVPLEVGAIAKSVKSILGSERRQAEMGEQGPLHAAENYDPSKVAARMLEAFRAL